MWLCIHLDQLPLDLISRGTCTDSPLVISDAQGVRTSVCLCNAAAQRAGIVPGMELSAAYALVPALHVHARQPQQEARALRQIAIWAGQYTSFVSLAPPNALLLEIAGSLKLFNGPESLRTHIRSGIEALGYQARIRIAATPLAALWTARADREDLATLPLHVIDVDTKTQQALYQLGLRTLGDCWQLPEAGLRTRFGAALCDQFARALGRQPDPRRAFKPPEHFSSSVLLAADIDSSEALFFPLRRLLLELEGFLAARHGGIQRFRLELRHPRPPCTAIDIELHKTTRDPRHWLDIAREKLSCFILPAPVTELTLRTGAWTTLSPRNRDWLSGADSELDDCSALIARLEARLGEDCVHCLALVEDHRPEKAWHFVSAGMNAVATRSVAPTHMPQARVHNTVLGGRDTGRRDCSATRPLWLFPKPLPLQCIANRPCFGGQLQLMSGPERIESGWWDDDDVTRDYFVATNPDGERLWIFRDRQQPNQWFLHGKFG